MSPAPDERWLRIEIHQGEGRTSTAIVSDVVVDGLVVELSRGGIVVKADSVTLVASRRVAHELVHSLAAFL